MLLNMKLKLEWRFFSVMSGSHIGWHKLLTQLSRSKLKLILADTDSNSKKWSETQMIDLLVAPLCKRVGDKIYDLTHRNKECLNTK